MTSINHHKPSRVLDDNIVVCQKLHDFFFYIFIFGYRRNIKINAYDGCVVKYILLCIIQYYANRLLAFRCYKMNVLNN